MIWFIQLFLCLAVFAMGAIALAQNRVALLIGNSNYLNESKLNNPVNDADLLAKTFKDLNFDQVIVLKNASRVQLNTSLAQFKRISKDADLALIYYSGHGMMNSAKQNYVLPTDMPKLSGNANLDLDLELDNNAVAADKMVDALFGSKIKLLILDACRDGPTAKYKSASKGLARMSQADTKGMLIAYATEEGKVAEDGSGKNSTYAASLAKNFSKKELPILIALDNVAQEVETATLNKQSPTRSGNLRVDTFLVAHPSTQFQLAHILASTNTTMQKPNSGNEIKPNISSTNSLTPVLVPDLPSNHSDSIELALAVLPNDSFEITPQDVIDLQPENLMTTDTLWRNESLYIKDSEIDELEKQSDLCNAKATFLLVNNYQLNESTNPKIENYFKNIKCVLAKSNHPLLMHSLAYFYMHGLGTTKDEKLAFEWYSRAKELGNTNSLTELANFYKNGRVVDVDIVKAYDLSKEAADLINPIGMTQLAHFYANGIVVQKDLKKAFELVKNAAVLHNPQAMHQLGVYYRKGLGTFKNDKEAFSWINKSAEMGNSDAMIELVEMYQRGIGVAIDLKQSEYWWEKSNKFSKN